MTEQLEQRRRNIAVMDLITESAAAHGRGDPVAAAEAMARAVAVDPYAMSVLAGGMLIGEIPDPQHQADEWAEYVAVNRDGLARLEQLEDGGDQDQAPDTTGEDSPQ